MRNRGFSDVSLGGAVNLSGGDCAGGHAGPGGTLTAISEIRKFGGDGAITLDGGTSTYTTGGGGTGGQFEVVLVSGTAGATGIDFSGTVSAVGGAGNVYGGDGGTAYFNATASDTDIDLGSSTFDVSGGSGGASGYLGAAGSVTAHTSTSRSIQDPATVTPQGAYIRSP